MNEKQIGVHKAHCKVNGCKYGDEDCPVYDEKLARQKIVCAAIRLKDGLIITGARHYDKIMHQTLDALNRFEPVSGDNQGFIDQWGNYLTRQEAYAIAEMQGQIHDEPNAVGYLYSEDLY